MIVAIEFAHEHARSVGGEDLPKPKQAVGVGYDARTARRICPRRELWISIASWMPFPSMPYESTSARSSSISAAVSGACAIPAFPACTCQQPLVTKRTYPDRREVPGFDFNYKVHTVVYFVVRRGKKPLQIKIRLTQIKQSRTRRDPCTWPGS